MLTGLPNRTHLRDLISEAIDACPAGEHLALAFLDVEISRTSTIRSGIGRRRIAGRSSPNACARRFARTTCWGVWAATNS